MVLVFVSQMSGAGKSIAVHLKNADAASAKCNKFNLPQPLDIKVMSQKIPQGIFQLQNQIKVSVIRLFRVRFAGAPPLAVSCCECTPVQF